MAEILKIAVIGDNIVGKTSLIRRYTYNYFSEAPNYSDYVYYTEVCHDNVSYEIRVTDTAAGEDYDKLRPVLYIQNNVFIICFALDNPISFENVTKKWLPEVKHNQPKTPYILVGTKSDLETKINREERETLKNKINASFSLECSAKEDVGVKEVFKAALVTHLDNIKRKQTKCHIQ